MKRISLFCMLLVLLSLGCAWRQKPDITDGSGGVPTREESLKQGIESFEQGIKAQEAGDREAARQAFMLAVKQFSLVDDQDRKVMQQALEDIKKTMDVSGFEYAPKEAFGVFLIYLKMQNAYMGGDQAALSALQKELGEGLLMVQDTSAKAKQKKIEELSQDIAVKRDEIKKQTQPQPQPDTTPETLPATYVVKKNETLPSIAARHEIYNDSFMWPLIYKANRDQIKDPKSVYVGQSLKIPRDVSTEEIIEARREAGAPDPEKIPKDANTPRRK